MQYVSIYKDVYGNETHSKKNGSSIKAYVLWIPQSLHNNTTVRLSQNFVYTQWLEINNIVIHIALPKHAWSRVKWLLLSLFWLTAFESSESKPRMKAWVRDYIGFVYPPVCRSGRLSIKEKAYLQLLHCTEVLHSCLVIAMVVESCWFVVIIIYGILATT